MSKKVAIIMANGCEEIEALTQVDVLRRAGLDCDMIGLDSLEVIGSHGIKFSCDRILNNTLVEYDLVSFPGGMDGSIRLRDNEKLENLMQQRSKDMKWNAAMCAAPLALAKYGLLKNHDYTMYPNMYKEYGDRQGNFKENMIVVDEKARLVTSRGPATALPYSFKLAEVLGVNVDNLKEEMLYNFLMKQK